MRVRVEGSGGVFEQVARGALGGVSEALGQLASERGMIMSVMGKLEEVGAQMRGVMVACQANGERITCVQSEVYTHGEMLGELSAAVAALDANVRLLAEAVGGLSADLEPKTAVGRLVARILRGGGDGGERSKPGGDGDGYLVGGQYVDAGRGE